MDKMDKKSLRPNRKPGNTNRKSIKNAGFIALMVLFALIIFSALGQSPKLEKIPITTAVQQANSGQYQNITITGNELDITKKGQKTATLKTYLEPNATLKDEGFNLSKVQVTGTPQSSGSSAWLSLASTIIPIVLIAGVLYFMLRSAQGQGNQAMSFGKSKARLYGNEKDKVMFTDIAGSDEAKQDLAEVVEFLRFPKKFANLGARIPKGVLLVGPPGTGKTM